MRATEQNERRRADGVDIDRAIAMTFVIGSCAGGSGGRGAWGVQGQIEFNLGFRNGLKAFTAAVLGGIGTIPGAALGGFIWASTRSRPALRAGREVTRGRLRVLTLVLVFRPSGLLGQAVGERA